MLEFRDKYKYNVYSQNGEDGIIEEIIKRCRIKPGLAIEFGGVDGYYCSNIRNLAKSGWQIIQYDISPSGGVIEKYITPANVNELGACNILSIDIDGNDYAVWEAYSGSPEIVIIEINSSLDPLIDSFDPIHGSNFSKMNKLGIKKGYGLICHTGNLIYLRHDLIMEYFQETIIEDHEWFDKSWL